MVRRVVFRFSCPTSSVSVHLFSLLTLVANDGQEALDNLYNRAKERAPPYDVILMDLEMPGECGLVSRGGNRAYRC